MATVLTYYGDQMSQTCRAVAIFLKVNNIAYLERRAIQRKGSAIEEQSRINLLHVVPAIDDDGFILTEGDAILKYLCGRYSVAEHWYPTEIQLRARVDEFCTWSNMNIHARAYGIYNHQILEPGIINIPVDLERLRRFQLLLERGLDKMDQVFLKDSAFVCGQEITIADVLVACEIMQAVSAGYNIQASHPKLAEWLSRVEKRLHPHFHDIHVMVAESKGLHGSVYHCGSFDM